MKSLILFFVLMVFSSMGFARSAFVLNSSLKSSIIIKYQICPGSGEDADCAGREIISSEIYIHDGKQVKMQKNVDRTLNVISAQINEQSTEFSIGECQAGSKEPGANPIVKLTPGKNNGFSCEKMYF